MQYYSSQKLNAPAIKKNDSIQIALVLKSYVAGVFSNLSMPIIVLKEMQTYIFVRPLLVRLCSTFFFAHTKKKTSSILVNLSYNHPSATASKTHSNPIFLAYHCYILGVLNLNLATFLSFR